MFIYDVIKEENVRTISNPYPPSGQLTLELDRRGELSDVGSSVYQYENDPSLLSPFKSFNRFIAFLSSEENNIYILYGDKNSETEF